MKYMYKILLALTLTVSVAQAQTVTTWGGTAKKSGNTANGNTLSNVKFNKPSGMAYDANGNIWITQEGSHIITMYNASDKKFYVRAGKLNTPGYKNGTSVNAQFTSPKGIAVGSKIYVVDAGNHCIRQIDLFTKLGTLQSTSLLAGSPGNKGSQNGTGNGARFNSPTDVAVDSKGNIYVADQQNHVIRKITAAGVVTTFAGQMGKSGLANGDKDTKALFNWPTSLYIDSKDNIYVGDVANYRVRKIDASTGSVSSPFNKGLWSPQAILIDGSGTMFISNGCQVLGYNASLSKDTLMLNSGALRCGFKNASDTNARFNEARSILQISTTEYIVADLNNHVIRKFAIDPCNAVKAAISAGGPTTFCDGGSVQLSGSSTFTNKWTWPGGSSAMQTVTATKSGKYVLEVSNVNLGCSSKDSVEVTVNPNPQPSISVTGGLQFCPGKEVTLSADKAYSKYSWSTNDVTKDIKVSTATTVDLAVTDANGCKGTSSSVTTSIFTVTPVSIVEGLTDKEACDGETITLNASMGYSNYSWSEGTKNRTVQLSQSGKVTVSATDGNGCESQSGEVNVTFNPLPVKPDIQLINDSLFTTASASDYMWYKDQVEQTDKNGMTGFGSASKGVWQVEITDGNGCSNVSDTLRVDIVGMAEFSTDIRYYPNPVHNQLTLELPFDENHEIVITSIEGKTLTHVHSANGTVQVDASEWPSGVVLVTVKNDQTFAEFKVVIE